MSSFGEALNRQAGKIFLPDFFAGACRISGIRSDQG